MKCQNCGINYDDGDKICPICETPSGQRGARANQPHYTSYSTTTGRNISEPQGNLPPRVFPKLDKAKSWSATGSVIAIVIAILGILLSQPDLMQELVYTIRQTFSEAAAPEPEYEFGLGDDYNEFTYDDVWVDPGSSFGTQLQATQPDGSTILLTFDDKKQTYALTWSAPGKWEYTETGDALCLYNWPDEDLYEEGFEPPHTESYMLYLDVTESSYMGDMPVTDTPTTIYQMILLYRNTGTGEITLSNYFGDTIPYFTDNSHITFSALQYA